MYRFLLCAALLGGCVSAGQPAGEADRRGAIRVGSEWSSWGEQVAKSMVEWWQDPESTSPMLVGGERVFTFVMEQQDKCLWSHGSRLRAFILSSKVRRGDKVYSVERLPPVPPWEASRAMYVAQDPMTTQVSLRLSPDKTRMQLMVWVVVLRDISKGHTPVYEYVGHSTGINNPFGDLADWPAPAECYAEKEQN